MDYHSPEGSSAIRIGSVARPDIELNHMSFVESEKIVEKYSILLDVDAANNSLKEKGGDENGLIPPGTVLLFKGSLIHAGPSNPNTWSRTAIFLESRRFSNTSYSDDNQMHPMCVAKLKYEQDIKKAKDDKEVNTAKESFFKNLAKCQALYGVDNKPHIIKDLMSWPIKTDKNVKTSFAEYEEYSKANY